MLHLQTNKVTNKNLCVSFKLEGVWVFTWFNFPHHSIFKLGCPELESISRWVVEVREFWEPGEWNGQSSLPQPCLPQSSFVSGDFAFRDPERVPSWMGWGRGVVEWGMIICLIRAKRAVSP